MDLSDFRTKKYSQTLEESVIFNLLDRVGPVEHFVVDIGAGPTSQYSNSQLLIDRGWKSCRFDLKSKNEAHARAVRVTAENVVQLLGEGNVPAQPGVLSIDIDGIDLYVLSAMLEVYAPSIIVYEMNGCREPSSYDVIPYDPNFAYAGDDYYGASWGAFAWVLKRRGYVPVHQIHSLNGFAVKSSVGLPACPMAPKWVYHSPTQRADARWVDCREVL